MEAAHRQGVSFHSSSTKGSQVQILSARQNQGPHDLRREVIHSPSSTDVTLTEQQFSEGYPDINIDNVVIVNHGRPVNRSPRTALVAVATQIVLMFSLVVSAAGLTILMPATPAYAADANCPVPSSPTLNPNSIYEVDDSRHLMWIRDDSTRWDDSYVMTANIDMGTCIWDSPIAPSWINPYTPFSGVFDGGGYTLTNLSVAVNTMSIDDSRAELAGFIGYMERGGTIRDITFDRALVTLDDTTNYDDSVYNRAYINVGVAVAYAEDYGAGSTLQNISVTNSTIRSTVSDVRIWSQHSRRSHVGAVSGQVWGNKVSGLTTSNNIVQNLNYQSTGANESPTGGIIGASVGQMALFSSTDDSVTVFAADATAGGVVGDVWSDSITDIDVIRPNVLAVSKDEALAGGAIGYVSGYGVSHVRVVDGVVTARPPFPEVQRSGGWFQAGGALAETDYGNYAVDIDVSGTTVRAEGWSFVNAGGVIGYGNDDTTSMLTSNATVQAVSSGDDYSEVTAGGLIGFKGGDLYGYTPVITSSYATGVATAWSDDTGAQVWVGGLIGWLFGGVENSYSTGDASATSIGQLGVAEAGGLVGASQRVAIDRSYSTGAATILTTSGDDTTGGLVGTVYSPGAVTQSYWNSTTSGQAVSDGGTALTTAQMSDSATFSGWNVVDGWQAQTYAGSPALPTSPFWGQCDVNSGFPFLLWEFNTSPCAVPPPPPPPTYPPSNPRDVVGTAGDESAVVAWTPPVSSGSFPVTTYQVMSTPGGKGCLVQAPELTCEVDGLTNGEAYTFQVHALNGAGWGPWSSASDPVTPDGPVTTSILITGSRGEVRGRPGVIAAGTSAGLGVGAIVRPMVRLAGEASYIQGAASILVDEEGAFTWQRRTGKKVYVYVKAEVGNVRSNRVVIPVQ